MKTGLILAGVVGASDSSADGASSSAGGNAVCLEAEQKIQNGLTFVISFFFFSRI